MWIIRRFTDHPASVNETYLEHLGVATACGLRLLVAGGTCLVHGLMPFLFVHNSSRAIAELHDRMVVSRVQSPNVTRAPRAVTGDSAPPPSRLLDRLED